MIWWIIATVCAFFGMDLNSHTAANVGHGLFELRREKSEAGN